LKNGINSLLEITNIPIYTPLYYVALFGLMRILGAFILERRNILLNKVSNELIINFSKDMIEHLMKMKYSIFKTNSEKVLNSFNKSLSGIERLNKFVIGNVMSNVIEITVISVMIFGLLGPKYFLSTITIYSLYLITTRKISKYRSKLLNDKFQHELKSENKLFDIIYNIENIKFFQRENYESQKFKDIIKDVRNKDVKVISSLAFLNNIQNLIISLGMVLNLTMGIIDCYAGILTPGDIVMMQAIFLQIMLPLSWVGMLMREVEETKVNLQYAIDMIRQKEIYLLELSKKKFENFEYKGGNIIFQNVDFHFPLELLNEFDKKDEKKETKFEKFTKSLSINDKDKEKDNDKDKDKDKAFSTNLKDENGGILIENELIKSLYKPSIQPKLILNECNVEFKENTINAIIGHSGNG
jgi:ATP-binding cassette subfamily B protein